MQRSVIKTTVKIEGMSCRMCEAHIADALRRELPVLRVRASRRRGEAVVISRDALSEEAIRTTLEATGYRLLSVSSAIAEKHGLFSLFHKG